MLEAAEIGRTSGIALEKLIELLALFYVKAAFSVALSHHPQLLLLDEATSGLDPVMRDEILDVLLEFVQDENHGVLFSSYITDDLEL